MMRSAAATSKKDENMAKVHTIVTTDLWKNNWILLHNDMPCQIIKI
jgi:hypothetical protein